MKAWVNRIQNNKANVTFIVQMSYKFRKWMSNIRERNLARWRYHQVVRFSSFLRRRVFVAYSTQPYQAPPTIVIEIPRAFMGVMVRLNIDTAKRIVKTCFTLATEQ